MHTKRDTGRLFILQAPCCNRTLTPEFIENPRLVLATPLAPKLDGVRIAVIGQVCVEVHPGNQQPERIRLPVIVEPLPGERLVVRDDLPLKRLALADETHTVAGRIGDADEDARILDGLDRPEAAVLLEEPPSLVGAFLSAAFVLPADDRPVVLSRKIEDPLRDLEIPDLVRSAAALYHPSITMAARVGPPRVGRHKVIVHVRGGSSRTPCPALQCDLNEPHDLEEGTIFTNRGYEPLLRLLLTIWNRANKADDVKRRWDDE